MSTHKHQCCAHTLFEENIRDWRKDIFSWDKQPLILFSLCVFVSTRGLVVSMCLQPENFVRSYTQQEVFLYHPLPITSRITSLVTNHTTHHISNYQSHCILHHRLLIESHITSSTSPSLLPCPKMFGTRPKTCNWPFLFVAKLSH